ncbi:inositol-trisphosphate 3-kinase homolog [Ylistrum balloti]|uniref:inositol-trisphosphate 3-kinase homolog n=1 Tax=Ylistrum balloti TaxID=509963 RepID=UPI002905CCC2|nr:inositol-trisphosphate 3-kinase homolog [Ylistrum balloti]
MGGCLGKQSYHPSDERGIEAQHESPMVKTMVPKVRKQQFKKRVSTRGVNFPELNVSISKEMNIDKQYRCNLHKTTGDHIKEGFTFGRFPKWRGYKMCGLCESEVNRTTVYAQKNHQHIVEHKPLCKKCNAAAVAYGMNNKHSTSEGQNLTYTALTHLLALTALDLTAPASDALLKNRKNAWIQLAGHPGSFAPAGPNTIWKRRITKDNTETKAYEALMEDTAHDIVPIYYREVEYNSEFFIEMEDLLQHFTNPNIMDIKIGKRTFLEAEVKNPVQRQDLYEKMIALDPNAPTESEQKTKSITKLRYMQFREQESSTAEFGFRIEALRLAGEAPETNLKKVKTKDQNLCLLKKYLRNNEKARCEICEKLRCVRRKFEKSAFLMSHEMIGSSLLVMYDNEGHTGVWMIDFSKAMAVDEGKLLTHRKPWVLGNHEDGYLSGLDNLIKIFEELEFPESSKNSTSQTFPSHSTTER